MREYGFSLTPILPSNDRIYNLSYTGEYHGVESVRICIFFGPYFPAFWLNVEIYRKSPYSAGIQKNTDQKNSEYGHFSPSIWASGNPYFCIFYAVYLLESFF